MNCFALKLTVVRVWLKAGNEIAGCQRSKCLIACGMSGTSRTTKVLERLSRPIPAYVALYGSSRAVQS